MTNSALQEEFESLCLIQHAAKHGEPNVRAQARLTLLDMAMNHQDDRIRIRAAEIVASREWKNVEPILFKEKIKPGVTFVGFTRIIPWWLGDDPPEGGAA